MPFLFFPAIAMSTTFALMQVAGGASVLVAGVVLDKITDGAVSRVADNYVRREVERQFGPVP